jgi:small-conductance mechanosensitive channel
MAACFLLKNGTMGWIRKHLHDSVSLEIALIVLTAFVFAWSVRLLLRFVDVRFEKLARRTRRQFDDVILAVFEKTSFLYLLVCGAALAAEFFGFGSKTEMILERIFKVGTLIQIGIWGSAAIHTGFDTYLRNAKENISIGSLTLLRTALKGVLLVVLTLAILNSFGINITALVAGLGIGGVAVALAVQNILGDLFASLSIVLDQPFVVGDFVSTGEDSGTIEKIGLKTTRVRSLTGEQLIFPNSNLLQSRLRNYQRMEKRRVSFMMDVPCETSVENLRRIPTLIRESVEKQTKVNFDRCHFAKMTDWAFRFETVYWVLTPDYNAFMDIQQAIYLSSIEAFRNERIEFAYPRQDIFVGGLGGVGVPPASAVEFRTLAGTVREG